MTGALRRGCGRRMSQRAGRLSRAPAGGAGITLAAQLQAAAAPRPAQADRFRPPQPGLDRRPREAKAFYAAIALATLGGVALNFVDLDPMRALYWAAVVNGLLAPPLMVVTMMIARNPRIMGRLAISRRLAVGGWLSTAAMWAVALLFLFG